MMRVVENWRFAWMSLGVAAAAFVLPVSGYAQVPVPAVQESITVSTSSPLNEATLDGSEVTVTLAGRTFERSIFSIRRAVSVSGVAGVSVGTFGITRAGDTKLTIELDFNGDFDEDETLRFTVGPGAIASYNGAALTRDLTVPSVEETVEASTASPMTEATLDGSVVTLTLAGRIFARSIFDVRDGVSVSGIAGVSVGTFGVRRVSNSKVTVELDFNGDFDEEGTLTFTVGADAIASYNGAALTAELTVSAGMESVTATTASPLTEATLDESVVTLTLAGGRYESSIFDVRDGVSVSGIAGVTVGTFGIQRVSDSKVTVELSFNGDFDSDGALTFTVGAGAIANYSGDPLTATLPVTAGELAAGPIRYADVQRGRQRHAQLRRKRGLRAETYWQSGECDRITDGGTLTLQPGGCGCGEFHHRPNQRSATNQDRASIYDYEVKNRYNVTVRVSDGQGGSATIDVTIYLSDVSEPPVVDGAAAVLESWPCTESSAPTWTDQT